jgi:hypothetical protein
VGEWAKAKTLNRIVSVLLVEAIFLCFIASYFLIYKSHSAAQIQSTVTLVIFNIIFVSLFYQINGILNLKLSLLAVGNFTGLCWNFVFNSFNMAGSIIYGETFNRLCLIFFPFLSSLWIVSFWSLSLTLVHRDNRVIKES